MPAYVIGTCSGRPSPLVGQRILLRNDRSLQLTMPAQVLPDGTRGQLGDAPTPSAPFVGLFMAMMLFLTLLVVLPVAFAWAWESRG